MHDLAIRGGTVVLGGAVVRCDIGVAGGRIAAIAERIEDAARQLRAQAGAPQLVVVAHSMGGLAARAWMRFYGAQQVARSPRSHSSRRRRRCRR